MVKTKEENKAKSKPDEQEVPVANIEDAIEEIVTDDLDDFEVDLDEMRSIYQASKAELMDMIRNKYGDNANFLMINENNAGYLVHVRNHPDSKVLFVCHIDTVQPHVGCKFELERIKKDNGEVFHVIHAPVHDDRIGVYTAIHALEQFPDIKYDILFTDLEEVGRTTCREWNMTSADHNYGFMIEFDRKGIPAVLYQYEDGSDAKVWLDALSKAGIRVQRNGGSFTDITAMGYMGIKGVNMGTGYERAHGADSYAIMEDYVFNLIGAVKLCRMYGNVKFPHTAIKYTSTSTHRTSSTGRSSPGFKTKSSKTSGTVNYYKQNLDRRGLSASPLSSLNLRKKKLELIEKYLRMDAVGIYHQTMFRGARKSKSSVGQCESCGYSSGPSGSKIVLRVKGEVTEVPICTACNKHRPIFERDGSGLRLKSDESFTHDGTVCCDICFTKLRSKLGRGKWFGLLLHMKDEETNQYTFAKLCSDCHVAAHSIRKETANNSAYQYEGNTVSAAILSRRDGFNVIAGDVVRNFCTKTDGTYSFNVIAVNNLGVTSSHTLGGDDDELVCITCGTIARPTHSQSSMCGHMLKARSNVTKEMLAQHYKYIARRKILFLFVSTTGTDLRKGLFTRDSKKTSQKCSCCNVQTMTSRYKFKDSLYGVDHLDLCNECLDIIDYFDNAEIQFMKNAADVMYYMIAHSLEFRADKHSYSVDDEIYISPDGVTFSGDETIRKLVGIGHFRKVLVGELVDFYDEIAEYEANRFGLGVGTNFPYSHLDPPQGKKTPKVEEEEPVRIAEFNFSSVVKMFSDTEYPDSMYREGITQYIPGRCEVTGIESDKDVMCKLCVYNGDNDDLTDSVTMLHHIAEAIVRSCETESRRIYRTKDWELDAAQIAIQLLVEDYKATDIHMEDAGVRATEHMDSIAMGLFTDQLTSDQSHIIVRPCLIQSGIGLDHYMNRVKDINDVSGVCLECGEIFVGRYREHNRVCKSTIHVKSLDGSDGFASSDDVILSLEGNGFLSESTGVECGICGYLMSKGEGVDPIREGHYLLPESDNDPYVYCTRRECVENVIEESIGFHGDLRAYDNNELIDMTSTMFSLVADDGIPCSTCGQSTINSETHMKKDVVISCMNLACLIETAENYCDTGDTIET